MEDHKSQISDKEKELLRKKLQEMVKLEEEENDLRKRKKEVKQMLNLYRPELDTTLQEVGRTRVKFNKTLISRVPKSQYRKPTLELTYQAIENILGKNAMENIKTAVKENRYIQGNEKEDTIKVIKTKQLRKIRKDKKPESIIKKNETRPKKLKYMKRIVEE